MKKHLHSLRAKMFLVYIVGIIMTFSIALTSWDSLNDLSRMVTAGEVVSDLFDDVLEIRRYEKNYFLYSQPEDLKNLKHYIASASELTRDVRIELFVSHDEALTLGKSISEYDNLIDAHPPPSNQRVSQTQWAKSLREKGKNILDLTYKLSKTRQDLKHARLRTAKLHLLYAVGCLVVLSVIGGIFFYHKALRPLVIMENHMNRITGGELIPIDAKFNDSELASLKVAFNKMILELQARQSQLIQSEKLAALGTLVFGVAHELNNPLSNVSSSCQILKEEIESDDLDFKKELLNQIDAETDRARDVVGSLLDYSREKVLKEFDISSTVLETIRLLKAEISPKIHLEIKVPEGIRIFGDKQKVQQVFLNLIKNAVDACGYEGNIIISADRSSGRNVEIVIQDDGIGMDSATMNKIFDPFFSSKTDKKGYGLGLFIVHNIIEEHGGTIDVDSRPGAGTVFTINLPGEGRA